MKFRTFLLFIPLIMLCGCGNAENRAPNGISGSSAETAESAAAAIPETADMITAEPEDIAAEETAPDHTGYFDRKDNIVPHIDGEAPDGALFWNYSAEYGGSRGFIVPAERMSNNYGLYVTARHLIDEKFAFESLLHSDNIGGVGIAVQNEAFEEGEYYPADPEVYFGCTTMQEMYDYYCGIYEGAMGIDGISDYIPFRDIDGVLNVRYTEGFLPSDGMEWVSAKIMIYDETADSASLIACVPHMLTNDNGEYFNYMFYSMGLVCTENGWRLKDNCLFYR